MSRLEATDFNRRWAKVINKAWNDDAFKQRLLQSPENVLSEEGLNPPPGVKIAILEENAKQIYLTLPAKTDEELSEDDLESIVRGYGGIGGNIWGGSIIQKR